jgi:hypothetical protein
MQQPALSTAQTSAEATRPRVLSASSVDPDKNAQLSSLIAEIRKQADAFVFLSGGASKMGAEDQRQLLAMFDALTLIVKSGRRIAVGDGGTQAGIMEAAGHARRASGGAFPLVGVAPAREVPPRGKTPLDPNHSHVVAVDNPSAPAQDSWGSETETMYWLFGKLAEGRPSVTIVANGGGITLTEVEANVRAGRRMILIEGSGRAANALVALLRKTPVVDAEVIGLPSCFRSCRCSAEHRAFAMPSPRASNMPGRTRPHRSRRVRTHAAYRATAPSPLTDAGGLAAGVNRMTIGSPGLWIRMRNVSPVSSRMSTS